MAVAVLFSALLPLAALAMLVVAVALGVLSLDHAIAMWFVVASAALLVWLFAGRFAVLLFVPRSADEPGHRATVRAHQLATRDKASLFVDSVGPREQFSVILTHGWGVTSDVWHYIKRSRRLERLGRITSYDLRGAGRSAGLGSAEYSLDALARDLRDVIENEGARRIVLIGQGLGSLVVLNYCKLFDNQVGRRVIGLVLVSPPSKALAKVPTTVSLAATLGPVVALLNRLAYLSGMAHIAVARRLFGGRETRGQLDMVARSVALMPPSLSKLEVQAGAGFDAGAVLQAITVPVLVVNGDRDAAGSLPPLPPGNKVEVIAHAGQLSVLERSLDFEQKLQDWLDVLPNGPGGRRGQRRQAQDGQLGSDEPDAPA